MLTTRKTNIMTVHQIYVPVPTVAGNVPKIESYNFKTFCSWWFFNIVFQSCLMYLYFNQDDVRNGQPFSIPSVEGFPFFWRCFSMYFRKWFKCRANFCFSIFYEYSGWRNTLSLKIFSSEVAVSSKIRQKWRSGNWTWFLCPMAWKILVLVLKINNGIVKPSILLLKVLSFNCFERFGSTL